MVFGYDLPVNLSITPEKKDYSLLWQKQAGTHEDTYYYSFTAPFGMKMPLDGDNVVVSGVLNKDLNVSFGLE